MKWNRLLAVIIVVMLGCSVAWLPQESRAEEKKPRTIFYLFWGDGCPHCEKEREFLFKIRKDYPEVEMRWFEIWNHPEYAKLADALSKTYKLKAVSVPMTFIGDWNVIGFQSAETTGVQIMQQLDKCANEGCKDTLDLLGPRADVEKIREEAAKQAPTDWELFPVAVPKDESK
ncbi:hypothetical protein ANT_03440 [Candidatus Moduliflexus flocculans]|uniref:Thioredoxin domain-containing protein n=1 Tax=Candidatus Moduliflexus flocculans TaxID=1499966 RepID=A0A081BQG0_9BACT|nr:hypothetical protein ANT_03440 [Candidatus Moduliflexus flocculans]